MRDARWWQRAVTYEVYVRSFEDTTGDGVGDLEGIRRHLDYLEWLGIDAIWLTPFYRSPMADFGYDIEDHTDVDPLFGTLGDFDRLVADAHERDIRVVVDYVPNHTSDRHPWFVDSRSSRRSRHRDWYYWRDPRPDGSPPNNWLSLFGGPAWQLDEATGQYYLHTFLPEQPDLNWRNPEVARAMHDVARFWLARGVDGFRIDVAAVIGKDPDLRDNPPNPRPGPIRFGEEWHRQLHMHDFDHPDVHEMWRAFRAMLDEAAPPERVAFAEVATDDLARWARFYGSELDEIHLPFGFHLLRSDWVAAHMLEVIRGVEAALPPGAWPNWVLGNHDEPRIAQWAGPERARVAMMLLLTLRGTPTMYYGDEIGIGKVSIPPGRALDRWERNTPGLGRDPARTPMRWTAGPNAGFSVPGVEPWLPVGDIRPGDDVEHQREDPRSMLRFTRALITLRRSSPALLEGAWSAFDVPDGMIGYLRSASHDRMAVVLNLEGQPCDVPVPGSGRIRISTLGEGERAGERVACPDPLRVRPYEGVVVELE